MAVPSGAPPTSHASDRPVSASWPLAGLLPWPRAGASWVARAVPRAPAGARPGGRPPPLPRLRLPCAGPPGSRAVPRAPFGACLGLCGGCAPASLSSGCGWWAAVRAVPRAPMGSPWRGALSRQGSTSGTTHPAGAPRKGAGPPTAVSRGPGGGPRQGARGTARATLHGGGPRTGWWAPSGARGTARATSHGGGPSTGRWAPSGARGTARATSHGGGPSTGRWAPSGARGTARATSHGGGPSTGRWAPSGARGTARATLHGQ